MKKQPRKTLRLGSFEQLESRALLAHAGMPAMMHDMQEAHGGGDFSRGPRTEMQSREFGNDFAARGERDPRETFRAESILPDQSSVAAPAYQVPSAIIIVPTAPLIIVIVPVQRPSFSEPVSHSSPSALSSSTQNRESQTSFVSSLSSSASNRPSDFSLPAAPTIVDRPSSSLAPQRSSLSVLSSLAVGMVSLREADAEESSEATTPTASQRDDREQLEEESQLTARQSVAAADVPESEDDAADELIELSSDDLRKRVRRKGTQPSESNSAGPRVRELATHVDRLSLRQWELPRTEAPVVAESVVEPVSDDLIELLTNDQIEQASDAHRVTPFAAAPRELEASLGYFQAVESLIEVAPAEPELPAAVAAAALPARAAQ